MSTTGDTSIHTMEAPCSNNQTIATSEDNSEPPTNASSKNKRKASGKKKRDAKNKSDVCDHFDAEECGTIRAKCNYCDANYACPGAYGTSTLRAHLRECKKYPYNDVDKKQKILAFKQTGKVKDGASSLIVVKFDQVERHLLRW